MHDLKIIVQRNNDAAKRMLGEDQVNHILDVDGSDRPDDEEDDDESETSKETS
jgi:hypothetical protein